VRVDFGVPLGSEPGFERPAVVLTADAVLEFAPRTMHVAPLTGNVERRLPAEVVLDPSATATPSAVQCHLATVIAAERIVATDLGSIGPVALAQVRAVLADLLDLA
jgi:mRNA-degrading endonuclease toxin of MazEF toxin-antitoxin module